MVLVPGVGHHGANAEDKLAHGEVFVQKGPLVPRLDQGQLEGQRFVPLLQGHTEAEHLHVAQLVVEKNAQVLHHELVSAKSVMHMPAYLVDRLKEAQ